MTTGPDEGILALVVDGCVKDIALHLLISPQRVHQIISNDPYNGYRRVHRALAASCPARAQSMADRFNATHDQLMNLRRPQRLTTAEALGVATSEGVDVIKAELGRLSVGARKQETIQQIRALWHYYDALVDEEEEAGALENQDRANVGTRMEQVVRGGGALLPSRPAHSLPGGAESPRRAAGGRR
jgi:hypothetical protein